MSACPQETNKSTERPQSSIILLCALDALGAVCVNERARGPVRISRGRNRRNPVGPARTPSRREVVFTSSGFRPRFSSSILFSMSAAVWTSVVVAAVYGPCRKTMTTRVGFASRRIHARSPDGDDERGERRDVGELTLVRHWDARNLWATTAAAAAQTTMCVRDVAVSRETEKIATIPVARGERQNDNER